MGNHRDGVDEKYTTKCSKYMHLRKWLFAQFIIPNYGMNGKYRSTLINYIKYLTRSAHGNALCITTIGDKSNVAGWFLFTKARNVELLTFALQLASTSNLANNQVASDWRRSYNVIDMICSAHVVHVMCFMIYSIWNIPVLICKLHFLWRCAKAT